MSYTISLNPLYKCNFRCPFCYLTEEQLSDNKRLDVDRLDELLSEVPKIKFVDFYGGEIGILKPGAFYEYKNVIRKYYDGPINIITNMSMIHDYFFDDDVFLSVSYDFEAREKHETVFQNMMMSEVPIAVLILATPEVIRMDVEEMISTLNMCKSIESVEIKPYSINQANAYNVPHNEFELFVIKWLKAKTKKNFDFINKMKITESLEGYYNAFSDDHVYITPNGKFGVLEFDKDDKEFFLELDSFDEYLQWAENEKIGLSDICKSCTYFGRCLTEHYRYVSDLNQSCNGYRGLLEYAERMEN
jgi:ACT domain-containing protein